MNWKWIGIIFGIFAGVIYMEFFWETPGASAPTGKPFEVTWELLYKLDIKTGKVPEELKFYDGKRVKIAGFVVPLSDNYSLLDEFLLVPDAQSCVHVPPPPPNLIVQAKLKVPISSDNFFNPAWITGILKIEKAESKYGAAGFQMAVEKIEKYNY
jgi:hypothetical protein